MIGAQTDLNGLLRHACSRVCNLRVFKTVVLGKPVRICEIGVGLEVDVLVGKGNGVVPSLTPHIEVNKTLGVLDLIINTTEGKKKVSRHMITKRL